MKNIFTRIMRIKSKLIASFVLVAVLSSFPSLFSLVQNNKLAQSTNEIINEKIPLVTAASVISGLFAETNSLINSFLRVGAEDSEVRKNIDENIFNLDLMVQKIAFGSDNSEIELKIEEGKEKGFEDHYSSVVLEQLGEDAIENNIELVNTVFTIMEEDLPIYRDAVDSLLQSYILRTKYLVDYKGNKVSISEFLENIHGWVLKSVFVYKDKSNLPRIYDDYLAWYGSFKTQDADLTKYLAEFSKALAALKEEYSNSGTVSDISAFEDKYTKLIKYTEGNYQKLLDRETRNYTLMQELSSGIVERISHLNNFVKDGVEKTKLSTMKTSENAYTTTIYCIIGGLVVSLVFGFFIGNNISKPIVGVSDVMAALEKGDVNVEVPNSKRKDEIGCMMKSVRKFKETALEKVSLEQEQLKNSQKAEEEKKLFINDLADRFNKKVQETVHTFVSECSELYSTSNIVTAVVYSSLDRAQQVSESSGKISQSVDIVASEVGKISGSINEVLSKVNQSQAIVKQAVMETDNASKNSTSLEQATTQIGDIVKLIQDIADQINLLALNATIESARAGEAGKGFAVVAGEIKNLAEQTTSATEDITKQISSIQGASHRVVEALSTIKTTINSVSEHSNGIAVSIQEKTNAITKISNNMQDAAGQTKGISGDISEIESAINSAVESSQSILSSSKEISEEAKDLDKAVDEFLAEIVES